jgi:hypothetical protein
MPGMRRRWRWQWKLDPFSLILGWVVFGFAAFFSVGPTTHGGRWWWLDDVMLGVWVGPLVLLGLGSACVWVIRHPPLRRELEHVEDLREAERIQRRTPR